MIPIIIVNWNGIEDTKECVSSVLELKGTEYKIYLIDNGSNEEEVIALQSLYSDHPKISLHTNMNNIGFSKAHIKIYYEELEDQNFEYIALLNNDTSIESNWLTELVKIAKLENADLVSSKMISYFERDTIDNTGHIMLNTGEILPIGHGENIENHNSVIENFGPCAGACLYSKKMIDEIGFFDSYFTTGYEDAEYGLRAIIAGYKSVYAPKAIVYHKKGQSVKKVFNFEYSTMIQTSILYSFFKNVPTINILLALPHLLIKNVILFIVNILWWRKKFLMVQLKSWVTILNVIRTILIKRKEAKSKQKNRISTIEFIKRTKFFFFFDLKRFWRIFIKREASSIDQYGHQVK